MDKYLLKFSQNELINLKILLEDNIEICKRELKSFKNDVDYNELDDIQIKNADYVINHYTKMVENYNSILAKIEKMLNGGYDFE